MSESSLAILERSALMERGYILEAQGLVITGEIDKLRWYEIGREIRARVEGSVWALGDWLIEGGREDRRWTGGSEYEMASQLTGYSKAHLSNAFRVAAAFPQGTRRPTLSWSVHKESLRVNPDDRGELLTKAAHNGWSADDMVLHINKLEAFHKAPGVSVKQPQRSYYSSPQVRCPECKHEFAIKGNKV
jgi:hypothetical protein